MLILRLQSWDQYLKFQCSVPIVIPLSEVMSAVGEGQQEQLVLQELLVQPVLLVLPVQLGQLVPPAPQGQRVGPGPLVQRELAELQVTRGQLAVPGQRATPVRQVL